MKMELLRAEHGGRKLARNGEQRAFVWVLIEHADGTSTQTLYQYADDCWQFVDGEESEHFAKLPDQAQEALINAVYESYSGRIEIDY